MEYVNITYAGAELEIPVFLESIWPYDLPLENWPTFCGAGYGIGDWIIPDKIWGAKGNAGCFIHDLDWAIADGSKEHFWAANKRFKKNLQSLLKSQIVDKDRLEKALDDCEIYYIAVGSPIGWLNYNPCGIDPETNPVVQQRLKRLMKCK